MGTILTVFLMFGLGLTGLIFASNYYTRFCIRNIVVRKLEWLDFVQDTALVPPDWRVKHEKKMAKLLPHDEGRMQKIKEKARADYLYRMDKLIHFATVCSLVPSDAERRRILKDLEEIKQEWKENDDAVFTPAR